MSPTDAPLTEQHTSHGLLVAFGWFAQDTGLVRDLMAVHIPQKVRGTPPQTKLVELCAGLLSGIEYLQDLSLGAQPLSRDLVVAGAWGQAHWVHSASVSRMLSAADATTLQDLRDAIDRFTRPFLAEALTAELLAGRELVWDLDLLGQAVSPTSTVYPEVAFGWMDDEVCLGYQLARVCVHTHLYGRIWLEGLHLSGNTAPVHCVRPLILAAEQKTHVRPRRRPELVMQRLAVLRQRLQRAEGYLAAQQARWVAVEARQREQVGLQYHLTQRAQQERGEARKARLIRQLEAIQRRLPRLAVRQTQLAAQRDRQQVRIEALRTQLQALEAWQAQLEADNASNPDAPVCMCRCDAAFCSGEELTWLIEIGYQVETKTSSGKIRQALRDRVRKTEHWTRVGKNAEMRAWGEYYLRHCPYPLTVALERFVQPGQTPRVQYGVLVAYRDTPAWPTLPEWFDHYNRRQTIEAGNKQMNTVHHVQHLLSHSKPGIEVQVLLTGLACNLTHFIQPWLRRCAAPLTPQLATDLQRPKAMVRVLANSTASVQQTTCSTIVAFAPTSSLPGVKLCLRGVPQHQLSLGFFQPVQFAT